MSSLLLSANCTIKSPHRVYRVLRTLGQGGFGITYLAETTMDVTSTVQGELGQVKQIRKDTVRVALKEFFMRDVNGREGTQVTCSQQQGFYTKYLEKFRNEAANLSRLHHEGIISVLEVFPANNTLYYAMEYIEGPSLQEYIQQNGPLPLNQGLVLANKIGDALSFMHRQRMLHLDLKPGNIMLRNDMTPVLIDFGLSKQYNESGMPESSTTIGAGTQGYAPIEQTDYHGGRDFPVTIDIYAYGATLYKMFTGNKPPVASDVMNVGLPLLPLQNHGVSPHIISIIQKAMMPLKASRFQSVEEMMRAINNPYYTFGNRNTTVNEKTIAIPQPINPINPPKPQNGIWVGVAVVLAIACVIVGILIYKSQNDNGEIGGTSMTQENSSMEGTSIAERGGSSGTHTPSRKTYTANGVSFTMIGVQGGTFEMGGRGGQTDSDEYPLHHVTLHDYYIGETEVTQELWEAVMGYNPSEFQFSGQHPVEFVSWDDCEQFIKKLNNITGESFRIPTEAEWEYAARGGQNYTTTTYAGSNSIGSVGWYASNSGSTTHAVKQKSPNSLGLYDMSGNLWEWCSDWYGAYSSNDVTNPQGPQYGSTKALRGGAWNGGPKNCRLTNRDGRTVDYASNRLGLRLALS
jgi:formylglycine-generating enzyme required for sulfatase activity